MFCVLNIFVYICTHLFLDEVHKYKGWSLEIKNAYDEFEDMHFVLSGSSLVNLNEGEADFTIDHQYTIEVGGRSKDGKQIAGISNSFIASADEEFVLGNKIPLWLFGFLY